MKHKKEWHTCDRCGAEITLREKEQLEYACYGKYSEPYPIFEDKDVVGEIIRKHILFPGSKTIELCPTCKKELERFMRNE